MNGQRGARVAPPPGRDEFDVRYADKKAAIGWEELGRQAATNTVAAWRTMRTDPSPAVSTPRHHQLKGELAYGSYQNKSYPQWQIEVTSGGRVWYLYDEARRTCWIAHASTGHPKKTE